MVPHPNPLETISRRRALLSALEDGPLPKRELVDHLECSRSTVDRGIRELESLSLLERADGDVRLTTPGRIAIEEYRRQFEILESVTDAGSVLQHVPPEAPLSTSMLEGATVHEPPPHTPNKPVETIASLLTEADRFRGFTATERTPTFRRVLCERTGSGELEAEVLFTDELVSFLLGSDPQGVHDILVNGTFDAYAVPAVPYELALVETSSRSVVFVVVSADGDVRGVIENDTPAAYEWGSDVYRRYRALGTRLMPPGR